MNALNSILQALAKGGEWERLNKSFDQEWYTVPEAHRELAARGVKMSLETLRRWIRAGKVTVKPLSKRKTLIHKNELIRLLSGRT